MDEKMNAPNIKDQAYLDYKAGMKYKDIARKYGVSLSAVKSWATRYWKTNQESCNQNKKLQLPATPKVATKISDKKKKAVAEDVHQIIQSDLTDRQQLFCLYFVRCFNAFKAYKKAFPDASDATARTNSGRLMQDDRIVSEINRLKQARLNRMLLDESDIFQMYLDIACADMNDFAVVKNGHVDLKDTAQSDGMLIQELSQGKAGTKVKLYDRMRALEWLADHMDFATPEQQARVALLKAQTDKLTGDSDKPEKKVVIINDV